MALCWDPGSASSLLSLIIMALCWDPGSASSSLVIIGDRDLEMTSSSTLICRSVLPHGPQIHKLDGSCLRETGELLCHGLRNFGRTVLNAIAIDPESGEGKCSCDDCAGDTSHIAAGRLRGSNGPGGIQGRKGAALKSWGLMR